MPEAMVTHARAVRGGLCRAFARGWTAVGRAHGTVVAMKPKTTIAITAAAGILGIGAAAVTLPAGAEPSASSPTPAVAATATPEIRTEVVRRTVHRRGRDHAEDGPHRSAGHAATTAPAPVATAVATAAPAVVRDDDDHSGHGRGGDDDPGDDHGGHGRDHTEDD
jgi:hypothetical protein